LENELANSRKLADDYAKIANSAVNSNRDLLTQLTVEVKANVSMKKLLRSIDIDDFSSESFTHEQLQTISSAASRQRGLNNKKRKITKEITVERDTVN
jgi:hypothetical protein